MAEKGKIRAKTWFWRQVFVTTPGFIKTSLIWCAAMLRNYLKISLRNIVRNKLFAVLNLLGLAVGLASFILISLWIQDELSFDRFHKNKNELYLLTITHPNGILDSNVPYALSPLLASQYPEIIHQTRTYKISNIMTCSFKFQQDDSSQLIFYEDRVILADPSFFSMFSFPFIYGDPENALTEPNSIVINEKNAEKYFGEKDPLGKKLTLNNRQTFVVSGVVRIPSNSHIQFDFLAPMSDRMLDNWNWADPSYVLLDKNIAAEKFREKIAGSMNKYFPNPLPGDLKVDILPVTKIHLSFGRKTYVYIFSIIAVFILMIACINYMNLFTACSNNRAKEVGLRKVVGASRKQLIFQFLGESVFMSALAFFLSILLVKISLPLMSQLTAKHLILPKFGQSSMYLLIIGLIFVVGIVAGSYPAIFLAGSKPINTLKAGLNFKNRRSPFRVISVVGQFTISILLIACTAVVFRQVSYVQNMPLGLKTDHVVKITINQVLRKQFGSLKNELLKNPGIFQVTAGQSVPYDDDFKTSGVEWEKKDPELVPLVRYSVTKYDYMETFGMEIKEGRSFSRDYTGDIKNYLINEAAAKYMGMESPVGQPLKFWGREGRIIGVVKDFHHVSLHREILPQVITANPSFSGALKYIFVKIDSTNIPDTIRFIKNTSGKFSPGYPFEYSFLDEGVKNLYQSERRLGKIFGYFAFLAVFISCLGIFGLSAFTAEQRTKEISIRKVLGASVFNIVLLNSKEFTKWVSLSNLLAWPVAWYVMTKWLENFSYRTGINLGLFALAGFISLAIAALTVSYQSIKTAMSNPIDALKYE